MPDLATQFQNALAKAAEYELLGSRAVDAIKREEYRVKAEFYHDMANELRREMAKPSQGEGGARSITEAQGPIATA
jgi:hypothetical protein